MSETRGFCEKAEKNKIIFIRCVFLVFRWRLVLFDDKIEALQLKSIAVKLKHPQFHLIEENCEVNVKKDLNCSKSEFFSVIKTRDRIG